MESRKTAGRLLACAIILAASCWSQTKAHDLLKQALYLGDRYNWAEAGPLFREAESLFAAAGDERNALHARLGSIRASVENGGSCFRRFRPSLPTSWRATPCFGRTSPCGCSR